MVCSTWPLRPRSRFRQMARRERLLRARLRCLRADRACDSAQAAQGRRHEAVVIVLLLLLAAIETLASYISRLYSEFGRFSPRSPGELDAWEEHIEPQLGLTRDTQPSARRCFSNSLSASSHSSAARSSRSRATIRAPTYPKSSNRAERGAGCRLLQPALPHSLQPHRVLVAPSSGLSAAALGRDAHTVFMRSSFSRGACRGASVRRRDCRGRRSSARSRREEGILEKATRPGPLRCRVWRQLVREVMTPVRRVCRLRHHSRAVPRRAREHNYSRFPVYSGSSTASRHRLCARPIANRRRRGTHRTVASIQRPAVFVPETKRGYELLREMQREKQHMRS